MQIKSKASGGGRPTATEQPKFVAVQILNIYVSAIQRAAPFDWSPRQLDFELFDRKSSDEKLTRDIEVTKGLSALAVRKSIPKLVPNQILSAGIKRAETMQRFRGGLQILYHPYVLFLAAPTDLQEIRTLLALCGYSKRIEIIKYGAFGASRNYRPAAEEIASFLACAEIKKNDAKSWRSAFPDLLAIALGLLLEATAIGDSSRLREWKAFFSKGLLRFSDWEVGEQTSREALDRWVTALLENCTIDHIQMELAGFRYLVDHVVMTERVNMSTVHANSFQSSDGPTAQELAWLFSSLIGGDAPTSEIGGSIES